MICAMISSAPRAAQDNSEQVKLKLASLIEDVLAKALSFDHIGDVPDFSTLDSIMPFWDQGKPGEARRKWVEGAWTYHHVKYRVDSIWLSSQITARIKGKKTVSYGRMKTMLYWWQTQDTTTEHYFFIIDAFRDLNGQWRIRSEYDY
jgi:hypothetical protein